MKRFVSVVLMLVSFHAVAQLPKVHIVKSSIPKTKERLALVIGNSAYAESPLKNPGNDADSMARHLKLAGFDVLRYENLDLRSMKSAINNFAEQLKAYKVGLFFFSGHGAEAAGLNYMFPIGAAPQTEADTEFECYSLNQVLGKMDAAQTNTNIVIVDACRNNPFKSRWFRTDGTQGFATIAAPKGTLIGFAASPGATASDGKENNGVYTRAIIKNIELRNVSALDMFTLVNRDVRADSKGSQVPFLASSLNDVFYFHYDQNQAIVNPSPKSKEKLISLRLKDMFPMEQLGKSDQEVWKHMHGVSLEKPLPVAIECNEEKQITYTWQYMQGSAFEKLFNSTIISPFYSDSLINRKTSYFVIFFEKKAAFKIEYRIAVKDYSEFLVAYSRLGDLLTSNDRYFYKDTDNYYSIWKNLDEGYIYLAVGLAHKQKACIKDWYYYSD